MTEIHRGGCHCGNIRVAYRTAKPVAEWPIRACQCSFCRKHGVRATGDPDGLLEIAIADEAKVIERIRKKLPAQVASLVKVKETVDKTALRKLKATDLAKLGLAVSNPVDEVTITVPSTDIDKLVDALLEEDGDADMEDAA